MASGLSTTESSNQYGLCRSYGRRTVSNLRTRRGFLTTLAVSTMGPTLRDRAPADAAVSWSRSTRRFHFTQIDVFTSERLQGNPLSVFTDARGLSDSEMQDLARETNLQETTFVFPRDTVVDGEDGVDVRIF